MLADAVASSCCMVRIIYVDKLHISHADLTSPCALDVYVWVDWLHFERSFVSNAMPLR